ncbi:hypothetical protein HRG84_10760 [Flavisolibacter sp. BT320]|nr:hypothetical protein [Flavisolibacter longurius]
MKQLIFLLLFPLYFFGQTVHHDDEKIIYKGEVALATTNADVIGRLQEAFPKIAGKLADTVSLATKDQGLEALTTVRLNAPYAIHKKLHFTLDLQPIPNGYAYTVDSVFVTERRRGWKEKRTDAKDMIEALEETGKAAIELEVLLNEIDLRIQQMLTMLATEMRKPVVNESK